VPTVLRQQQQKQQALGLAGSPAIPPSAPWQQQSQQQMQLQQQQLQVQDQLDQLRQTAANQIQQSEQNLAAQYTSLMQQQQVNVGHHSNDNSLYCVFWLCVFIFCLRLSYVPDTN
jgi:hypothetical protein